MTMKRTREKRDRRAKQAFPVLQAVIMQKARRRGRKV